MKHGEPSPGCRLEDARWIAAGLFFLVWTGVYFATFVYGSVLVSEIAIVQLAVCTFTDTGRADTDSCDDSDCALVGVSVLILGVCGTCLYGALFLLALSLRKAGKLRACNDADTGEAGRSRRGGVDQGGGSHILQQHSSVHTIALDGNLELGIMDGPPISRTSTGHLTVQTAVTLDSLDDYDQSMRTLSTMQTELSIDDPNSTPADSPERATADSGVEARESGDGGRVDTSTRRGRASGGAATQDMKERLQLRPCAWIKCCEPCIGRRCPSMYVNPAQFTIPLGEKELFDLPWRISCSSVLSQCCMLPWFVAVVLCTATVVGQTNPLTFGLNDGVCQGNVSSASVEGQQEVLKKEGVQLTWFAVIFTWTLIGIFGLVSFSRTAMRKCQGRVEALRH